MIRSGTPPSRRRARRDRRHRAVRRRERCVLREGGGRAGPAVRSGGASPGSRSRCRRRTWTGLAFVRDALAARGGGGRVRLHARRLPQLLASVDCLQADVTRCGGITGLLRVERPRGGARPRPVRALRARSSRRRRCAASTGSVIWSTSTTTCASRRCSSTACSSRSTGCSCPIDPAPATAWSCGAPMRSGGRHEALENVRAGRTQKLLAALAAVSAPALGFEIYLEHYKGSFGDKWMWTPLVLTPPLAAAGMAGFASEKAARTVLPAVSALYALDGLAGIVTHVQGLHKRPGGLQGDALQPGDGAAAPRAGVALSRRRVRDRRRDREARAMSLEGPARTPIRTTAAPARGDDATDGRPLPRLRRAEQADHWDEVTRRVVLDRVENVPPIRFFDHARPRRSRRSATSSRRRMRSRGSRCSPTSTRSSARGGGDGWRYVDLPDDGEVWRRVRAGLDDGDAARGALRAAPLGAQDVIVQRFSKARAQGLGRAERRARLEGGHALRRPGVLLPPVGVERDRVRRPRLSARLRRLRLAAPGRARIVGG